MMDEKLNADPQFVVKSGKLLLHRNIYGPRQQRKKYCALLSDGSLRYFDDRPVSITRSGSQIALDGGILDESVKPRGIIPIPECLIDQQGAQFTVKDLVTHEKFTFEAESKAVALQWMHHLQLATVTNTVSRHIRKNSSEMMMLGRCSWCLQNVYHGVVENNLILRPVLSCTNCGKRTVPCRTPNCKDLARGHRTWDDELCIVHDGTLPSWELEEQEVKETLAKFAYCTWCNSETSHEFVRKYMLRRDKMRCRNCNNPTGACKTCETGMAKAGALVTDKSCGRCDPTRIGGLRNSTDGIFRFDSFAPERTDIDATFLIDAKDTFEEMRLAMLSATTDMYMSFWLMCAVVRLRRSQPPQDIDRLDKIFEMKAKEGVKIYILLWNEPTLLVNNFSKLNKEYLEAISANIHVLRHPRVVPVIFSHHQKFLVVDQRIAFVGGIDLAWGRYDWHEHRLTDTDKEHWWGVDYYNPHISPPGEFYDILNPDADHFDRKAVIRMPWHDVDIKVNGLAARDVAENFIQRWNHHKAGDVSIPELVLRPYVEAEHTPGTFQCQVVRSLSAWSGSPEGRTECSIYRAYLHYIENSKFLIYIENQFFVSGYGGTGVANQITAAIHKRIRIAIQKNEKFRCIVVFPQPEEVGRWAVPTLLRELRTASALRERIQEEFPSVSVNEYLSFYQLRSHGYLYNKPVTDQIFVHSKMIIIDDTVAIVGSNNINDRSFLGDRDSELAIIATDSTTQEILVDGKSMEVSAAVHKLRLTLWNEHLGYPLDDQRLSDPLACTQLMNQIADRNTECFEVVFGFIPSNRIRDWDTMIQANLEKKIHNNFKEYMKDIQGFLCHHPLYFLADEPPTTREGIMFTDLFQ